jgi:DNA-binding beta-propeller fold protein YncE
MISLRSIVALGLAVSLLVKPVVSTGAEQDTWIEKSTAQFLERISRATRLPLEMSEIVVQPPYEGWAMGRVSSVAASPDGLIYVLHRQTDIDPVVVLDRSGEVIKTWGKGLFSIPHSIRVDPSGNIWTVDAGNSRVYKFSPDGEELLHFDVGQMPELDRRFRGAADIAFASDGHLYVADGYGNARVLEYDESGQKIREWGRLGASATKGGPGDFRIVHGIAVDDNDIIYVADRENGRIQRFQRNGEYVGMWDGLGKVLSLFFDGNALWVSVQRLDRANLSQGWLLRLNPEDGAIIDLVAVPEAHSVSVTADGEPLIGITPNRVLLYRQIPTF